MDATVEECRGTITGEDLEDSFTQELESSFRDGILYVVQRMDKDRTSIPKTLLDLLGDDELRSMTRKWMKIPPVRCAIDCRLKRLLGE